MGQILGLARRFNHNALMFCYLHVPFCRSRCIYCDFYVTLDKTGDSATHQAFEQAVVRELAQRVRTMAAPPTQWHSLYAGGGTPSLLSAAAYTRLMDAMRGIAPFSPQAECTLEINPDALCDPPQQYRDMGFTRASVGVQSFDEALLKRLSRRHSARQAIDVIHQLANAGFENISLDLMYGLPGQSASQWADTLACAVSLPVTHISAYGLKVEAGTPLARLSHVPRYAVPDEDTSAEMVAVAVDFLHAHGFERYEISNFARAGFESAHNLNYWRQGEWLALGPGACGSLGGQRYETIRDLSQWQHNPLTGDVTPIPDGEALENALIFGLRLREGVWLPALAARFGQDALAAILARLAPHRERGWLCEASPGRLTLSAEALALSNVILCDVLEPDEPDR